MIKYSVSDLISSAKQIADLENSDFISWNENIRLINEAYVSLYQKLINKGEQAFISSLTLGGKETELPNDFWQLKSIYEKNNGNITPILRRSDSEGFNSRTYEIKNGKIHLYGVVGNVVMEYFKTPKTLTYKPKELEVSLPKTPLACSDKLYLLEDGSLYDLEEGEYITEPKEELVDVAPYIMSDNYLITKDCNVMNLITEETTKEERVIVIDGKVYSYDKETKNVIKNGTVIYTLEDDLFPEEVNILMCNTNFEKMYGITNLGKLYYEGTLIENVKVKECKYSDGNLYVNDVLLGMIKVEAGEVYIIETLYEPKCINKIDNRTGYGFTTLSRKGFFIESYLQDTYLNFPNSFYFQVLSYILAIAYKSKQNADTTFIANQLSQMEYTFYDTLTSDDNAPMRIKNVY